MPPRTPARQVSQGGSAPNQRSSSGRPTRSGGHTNSYSRHEDINALDMPAYGVSPSSWDEDEDGGAYDDGYHGSRAGTQHANGHAHNHGHSHTHSPRTPNSNSRSNHSTPTSRKPNDPNSLNLNHLLNFRMPPRTMTTGGSGAGSANGSGVPRRSRGFRGAGSSKEKYVNAQFRFVMKPNGNYTAHFADPDLFFPWQQILQVIVPTSSALSLAQGDEEPSDPSLLGGSSTSLRVASAERRLRREREKEGMTCPICLGRPVAGRMTKCGHIFCFPCILHYFQLSDIPKCAKCPICGETIQEFLLKSIRWWHGETYLESASIDTGQSVGGSMTQAADDEPVTGDLELDSASLTKPHRLRFRLVQRPQITTLGLPRSSSWPSEAVPQNQAPWHFIPNVMTHAKFMLATSQYMLDELSREMRELEVERRALTGDELGQTFVDAAMRKVSDQMEKAKLELTSPVLKKMEKDSRDALAEVDIGFKKKARELAERQERERERREREEAEKSREEEELAIPHEMLELTAQGAYALANRPAYLTSSKSAPVVDTASHVDSAVPTIAPSGSAGTTLSSLAARNHKTKRSSGNIAAHPSYFASDDPSYLYYQEASGANIYLSPLDIKILLSHYKSYRDFPEHITIRPEGADEGTMNEDLRRRCKYLSHLQVGTDIVFVEADLEEAIGAEAVAAFEAPLKRRRDRRRDKVKKEDKAKSRWEAQEREKLPFGTRFVPGPPANGDNLDEDFIMALERSNLDVLGVSPTTSSLIASMANGSRANGISPSGVSSGDSGLGRPSTSPPIPPIAGVWGSPASSSNGNTRTWASALASAPGRIVKPAKTPAVTDEDVSKAWQDFEATAAGNPTKSGKKGKKKLVLNMAGGGRQA